MWQPRMHESLPCSSTFSPRVKLSWKAHTTKILLREIFSREHFITRKFPDIRYARQSHHWTRLWVVESCPRTLCFLGSISKLHVHATGKQGWFMKQLYRLSVHSGSLGSRGKSISARVWTWCSYTLGSVCCVQYMQPEVVNMRMKKYEERYLHTKG